MCVGTLSWELVERIDPARLLQLLLRAQGYAGAGTYNALPCATELAAYVHASKTSEGAEMCFEAAA